MAEGTSAGRQAPSPAHVSDRRQQRGRQLRLVGVHARRQLRRHSAPRASPARRYGRKCAAASRLCVIAPPDPLMLPRLEAEPQWSLMPCGNLETPALPKSTLSYCAGHPAAGDEHMTCTSATHVSISWTGPDVDDAAPFQRQLQTQGRRPLSQSEGCSVEGHLHGTGRGRRRLCLRIARRQAGAAAPPEPPPPRPAPPRRPSPVGPTCCSDKHAMRC